MPSALFLAQSGLAAMYIAMFLALLIAMFVLLRVLLKCYVRCPSNRLLVVYGKTESGDAACVVHGGARFVVPLAGSDCGVLVDSIDGKLVYCEGR
jgi:uncharacterized membrane protein YqiK